MDPWRMDLHMADVDESKHCSFNYNSYEFPCTSFYLIVLMFFFLFFFLVYM